MSKKIRGFTLLEIMIGLFVSALVTLSITNLLTKTNNEDTATSLAGQTIGFSDTAANYLTTNYFTISKMMKNQSYSVIQWSTINGSDFNDIGNTLNTVYKQIPCVVLVKETNVAGGFTPYLFFVNTSTTKKFPAGSSALKDQRKLYGSAASIIGASAGQIMQPQNVVSGVNGVAYGVNKSWSTVNSSVFTQATVTACGGTDIDNRGLVINLSYNKKFIIAIDDSSLQKITSTSTSGNPNQLTSSISFAEEYRGSAGALTTKYHALVLDKTSTSKNIIFASGQAGSGLGVTNNLNQLNVINTGVQAGKITLPDNLKNEFTSCKSTEVGNTISGQMATTTMGIVQTMLTCANSNSCSTSPCYISRFRIRINSYFCNPNTGSCNPYKNNPACTLVRPYQAAACTSYGYTVSYGCTQTGQASCAIGSTYNYPGSCGTNGGYALCDGVTKNGKSAGGSYNCYGAGCAGGNWYCSASTDEILAQYDCQQ